MTDLWCEHNQLTTLPVYPNLIDIMCYYNKLTTLPVYPKLKYKKWDDMPFNLNTKKGIENWNKRQKETNKVFMEYFEEYTNLYIPLNSILDEFTMQTY